MAKITLKNLTQNRVHIPRPVNLSLPPQGSVTLDRISDDELARSRKITEMIQKRVIAAIVSDDPTVDDSIEARLLLASVGTGPTLSNLPPQPLTTVAAPGVEAEASRADHSHEHGVQPGGTLHSAATTSNAGFMSNLDKQKLNSIAANATANQNIVAGTGLTGGGSTNTVTLNANFGTVAGQITEGNDSRIPTQPENDALLGTSGSPSSLNRYVTNADPRMTNSRIPTGSAGGDLNGSYPNPEVVALTELGGPTRLTLGTLTDGQFLRRTGNTIESAAAGIVPLSDSVPQAVGTGAPGVSSAASRADHIHAHGNQAGGSLHALATSINAGFMSATDKTKLNTIEANAKDDQVITAGVGLTGGGSGDVTLDVVFGDGAGQAIEGTNSRLLTQAENDAAQGTSGSPSNVNRFVTDQDTRLTNARTPTVHATTHSAASSDPIAVQNLASGAASGGDVLTADGFGGLTFQPPGTPGPHAASHSQGGIDEVLVSNLASGAALANQVLIADGANGLDFGPLPTQWKQSVRAATIANIDLNTELENGDTLDGVALVTGDRVLVKDQTVGAQNGIYVVQPTGAPVRAVDLTTGDNARGVVVSVEEGSDNVDTIYVCINNRSDDVVGTNALTFSRFDTPITSTAPVDVTKSPAVTGISNEAARADHKHDVSTGVPVTIGTANSEGAATALARRDHVHAHGAQTDGSLHALATASVAGFLSPVDKVKLDDQDLLESAGLLSGGVISDIGAQTISVSAGTGRLRTIDDPTDTLADFTWVSNTFVIPTDTVRYVGVEYNGGTPQVVVRTTHTWNLNSEFPLGAVANEADVLYLINIPHSVQNFPGLVLRRLYETHQFIRDEEFGGLLIGETGTRNITVAAGVVWNRLTRFTLLAKDTSVADTFDAYYADGVGGFSKTSAQTQWDNLNYDDGSGTLAALPAGTYGIHWVYMLADDTLALLYGVQAHASAAEAEVIQLPQAVPDRIEELGVLVGKILFEQGASSALRFQSSFDHVFPPYTMALHNNLGALQGGTTTQRYHATADQAGALAGTSGSPSAANRYVTNDDPRNTDSRPPTGTASGQLGGTYPGPDVRGMRETGGPTLLSYGAVSDGQFLTRNGTTVEGVTVESVLTHKNSVRVATFVAGTLATDFENGDTVDGVTLATGDRILIKDQVAPIENGIYIVQATGAPVRDIGFAAGVSVAGSSVFVQEGTQNFDTEWVVATNQPNDVVGTDGLTFSQKRNVMARIGASTYSTVQHMQDIFHSTGYVDGGAISDVGGGSVSVAAGRGFIRSNTTKTSTLYYFDWTSDTVVIPSDSVRYIGVEYNAGSPQVAVRTTLSWDNQTEFALGNVINEAGVLHLEFNPQAVGDHAGAMIQRLLETVEYRRDDLNGGLLLGETGTRNVTVTAGAVWKRLNRTSLVAIDTSVADTFDAYYRDGVGGFTKVVGLTQYPNTLYDDGTGTLAAVPAGQYAVHWFYMELDSNPTMIYGRGTYLTFDDALDEAQPATVPLRIEVQGFLIGRIIIQEGAGTGVVQSSFTTNFTAGVSSHNNLGNLQGGTTDQYYHSTADQNAALAGTAGAPSDTNRYVTNQDTRLIQYDPRIQLIFDHMISSNVDADEYAKQGWRVVASGAGSSLSQVGEAGHPGIAVLTTGTANNGYCTIYAGSSAVGGNIVVGGTNPIEYECLIKFTGSIAQTNLELAVMGFGLEWASVGELLNGVYVRFNPAVTNVFAIVASTAGVRSNANGTTVVAINTWYRVGFVISNPGVSPSVQLYVNGVAEGTPVTTNITTAPLGVGQKTDGAGGVGSNLLVDYVQVTQDTDLED